MKHTEKVEPSKADRSYPELSSELSSHSECDEDYHPSSTQSSSEGEVLSEESESSSHYGLEKDHCPSSSSEHEVLEAEGQGTKAKSNQLAEQLKRRRKKKRPQVTVKTSKKKKMVKGSGTKPITVYSVKSPI